jgi:hypothetical protein
VLDREAVPPCQPRPSFVVTDVPHGTIVAACTDIRPAGGIARRFAAIGAADP